MSFSEDQAEDPILLGFKGLGQWRAPRRLAPDYRKPREELGHTITAMYHMRRAVFASIAVLIVCGSIVGCLSMVERRHRSAQCIRRGIALNSQVEALQRVALGKLTIGAEKEDVIRFFAENNFPITFTRNGATGTIYTSGCSPKGCGTDQALIGLRVDLDDAGKVKAPPVVVSMYTACL